MPKMSDVLHDEIDLQEVHRNKAKEKVELIWRDRLRPVMLEAANRGEDTPAGDIMLGLQTIVREVSKSLAPLTTRAVKQMAKKGLERNKAKDLGQSFGDTNAT